MCRFNQPPNLIMAIQMRRSPTNVVRQKLWGWNFRARINRAHIFGKATYHRQAMQVVGNLECRREGVREFLGAMTDEGVKKGIFITSRGYTDEAKQLAEKHAIEIVNEHGLAMMLEATNARFDPETLVIPERPTQALSKMRGGNGFADCRSWCQP